MELIVRRDGREERLRIERRGRLSEIEIGGRTLHVDATAATGSVRSLLVDGRQYEVAVRPQDDGAYQVSSAGGLEVVEVLDPLTHLAEQSHAAVVAAGPQRTAAYMPGRVAAVLVAEGESVEAGRGVVVLEAMKMENEIQAERAGTVTRLYVEPGQAVETGDPLFEIE